MRAIAVVITARPSYARIKTVLKAINEHPDLKLRLILAASALLDRYGNVAEIIKADGFHVDAEVHTVLEGSTPLTTAKTMGYSVGEIASVLDGMKPDAVLTVADRYETLATAIAGAYLNIPVVHVQGGEISGNIDEKVRHAVTKLADLHFVASDPAYDRLFLMGERPRRVWVTGCPSIDLCAAIKSDQPPPDLGRWVASGTGAKIDQPYIIAMQHPVSYEWEMAGEQMEITLAAVRELGFPCFWFWPNVDAGSDLASKAIRLFHERYADANIRFIRNMPPEVFLWLLRSAQVIVGNSSAAIREASFFGTPAVDIGSRQDRRDKGPNVIRVAHDKGPIQLAILDQYKSGYYPPSTLYGSGNAGATIASLLATQPLTTEKRFHDK